MNYWQLTASVKASAAGGPPGPLKVPDVKPWFDAGFLQQLEQQLEIPPRCLLGAQVQGKDQQQRQKRKSGEIGAVGAVPAVVQQQQPEQQPRHHQQQQQPGEGREHQPVPAVIWQEHKQQQPRQEPQQQQQQPGYGREHQQLLGEKDAYVGMEGDVLQTAAVRAAVAAVDETRVLGELLARHIAQAIEELKAAAAGVVS